jgi:hypothetical protein
MNLAYYKNDLIDKKYIKSYKKSQINSTEKYNSYTGYYDYGMIRKGIGPGPENKSNEILFKSYFLTKKDNELIYVDVFNKYFEMNDLRFFDYNDPQTKMKFRRIDNDPISNKVIDDMIKRFPDYRFTPKISLPRNEI